MQSFIVNFNQALTPGFCQDIIRQFEQDPNKQAGRTGAGVDKQKKDSTDLYISQLPQWQTTCDTINNTIFKAVTQYAKAYPYLLTGAISPSIQDPKTGETRNITAQDIQSMADAEIENLVRSIYCLDDINLQKYQKAQGGYHHWHSEHYPSPTDPKQRTLHRVLLWLIYLNDVSVGGETEFLFQQAKIKASQGSLVLAPCGFTHTHRGCVPQSSDKYVLASWVMYRDAKSLYQTST